VSEPLANWTPGFVEDLRRRLSLHQAISEAQRGDFYRLTADTAELRAWEGWQLHDTATGKGVIALWRSGAPAEQISVRPRALDPSAVYVVTDLNSGATQMIPGDTLGRELVVVLPPAGAALRTYQPVEKGSGA
jgi:hypothetical protein